MDLHCLYSFIRKKNLSRQKEGNKVRVGGDQEQFFWGIGGGGDWRAVVGAG